MSQRPEMNDDEAIRKDGEEEILVRVPVQDYYLDQRGREMPDPTPIAPPVNLQTSFNMTDHLRRLIRSEQLAREAYAAGQETFEEADDFDVGDDPDLYNLSGYENEFEPPAAQTLDMSAKQGAADGSPEGAKQEPPAAPPAEPLSPAPQGAPQ